MGTIIKSYTDLEQSKKLAEILPFESADMYYVLIDTDEDKYDVEFGKYIGILPHYPCWSLAALFKLMPNVGVCSPVLIKALSENKYYCHYIGIGTYKEVYTTSFYDESIDACYEMILKLYELNLL